MCRATGFRGALGGIAVSHPDRRLKRKRRRESREPGVSAWTLTHKDLTPWNAIELMSGRRNLKDLRLK